MLKLIKRSASLRGRPGTSSGERGRGKRIVSDRGQQAAVEESATLDAGLSNMAIAPSPPTVLPPADGEASRANPGSEKQKTLPAVPEAGFTSQGTHLSPNDIPATSSRPTSPLRTATPSNHGSPALIPQRCSMTTSPSLAASDNWTTAGDADGAYVRRTYAHFDQQGVRGDGLVEGKEWTRERGSHAAWEEFTSSTSQDAIVPRRKRSSQPTTTLVNGAARTGDTDLLAPPVVSTRNGRSTPASSDEHAVPSADSNVISGNGSSAGTAVTPVSTSTDHNGGPAVPEKSPRHAPLESHQQLGQGPLGISTSSLGTQSDDSVAGQDGVETKAPIADDELNVERQQLMGKIDRYGFFPTADGRPATGGRMRMTVLPQQALERIPRRRLIPHSTSNRGLSRRKWGGSGDLLHVDQEEEADVEGKGALRQLQSAIERRARKEAALQKREATRARKWDRMLQVRRDDNGRPFYSLPADVLTAKKLRRRVYKGIPDRWRAAVWWALLQARPSATSTAQLEARYAQLQSCPSSHDVQIDLDVPRTISGHILFHTRYGQGQRALFHVLHAFSLVCDECAYCQGMGPIVATLLVYQPPARAFAALVELHNDASFGIHQSFSPGFPGLVENFWVQQKVLTMLCPDVVTAMDKHGIVTSAYATKWYITLFTNVVPFATQLRLWDCYFLHGRDVLVVAACAILWSLRQTIVQGDFETCMGLLSREFVPIDDDLLLNWIYQVIQRDDVRRCMQAARKEWSILKAKGQMPIL